MRTHFCGFRFNLSSLCICVFFQNTVDKLIKKTNLALVVGSSSWREQFVSAVTVSAGQCLSVLINGHIEVCGPHN